MQSNLYSLHLFAPEIVLVAGILLLLVWDIVFGLVRSAAAFIALAALFCSAVVTLTSTSTSATGATELFSGLAVRDPFSDFFKLYFILATGIIVVISLRARDAIERAGAASSASEYYALLLALCLGMDLMASAQDLLMAYLSLEMVSLVSYIIVGFKRRSRASSEAALKYVIYGGVASGVMLFGLSLLYGVAGATGFAEVHAAIVQQGSASLPVVVLAVVCVMAGFGYKVASVPFHMWCPDVYEGAPTPVTALLSVGPKAAGFALILRFFAPGASGAVPDDAALLGVPWTLLLGVIAAATMTLGNLAALHQSNIKRLLAYSSIAHAGYILMALCVFSKDSERAVLFYLVTYLLMNLGAFVVVIGLSEAGVGETVESYRGLGTRAPLFAAAMGVFLFSLTGIPPMAGFIGKFYLFAAVLQKGGTFYLVLAIVGIVNSAISLYYYARILKEMYFNRSEEEVMPIHISALHRTAAYFLALPTIGLGLYWGPIVQYIDRAVALFG